MYPLHSSILGFQLQTEQRRWGYAEENINTVTCFSLAKSCASFPDSCFSRCAICSRSCVIKTSWSAVPGSSRTGPEFLETCRKNKRYLLVLVSCRMWHQPIWSVKQWTSRCVYPTWKYKHQDWYAHYIQVSALYIKRANLVVQNVNFNKLKMCNTFRR